MATDNNRPTASRAIHPGEILREELIAREIKQKDFAQTIGMRPSHLNDIIRGRRNMSESFAQKLEEALGTPAESWMRLHYFYLQDLKALAESKRIKERKSLPEILRNAIARQGLTQKQIADIVGVSESQIIAFTTGKESPTLQTAGSLSMALGIAPATMLGL